MTALGLTWPSNRSFPTFAPIEQLDVLDASTATADQKYLWLSLEGLVNRTRPRIYVKQPDGEGATFWVGMLNVPLNDVAAPMSLLTKYASEIKGYVIYDPALLDTVNLATTIAGVEDGLVASPALAATLAAAPYGLHLLADLRTNHFSSANAVYQYEQATYATKTTNRLIIGLNPTDGGALRDYAVATRAMVVWLDPTDATENGILGSILSGLAPNAPYMGWWVNEGNGVNAASKHAVPVFAADYSRNLTVFGGAPIPILPPPPPLTPSLANKAFVAIFMSDGDNLQENQHLIPTKWADPNRGKVPISWTVQPALVDVAPVILAYYWRTATPNDVLVSGPSGLGYTYPVSWPGQAFGDYTLRSADYLSRAGLGVITVWNDGQALSGAAGDTYATNMPHLLGVTDQIGAGALSILKTTLPRLAFASNYAADEASLEAGIDAELKSWTKKAPLFVAVQGDMNKPTINPTTFLAVQNHYASNADVVFVRGDQLFRLIRQSAHLAISP